MVKGTRITVDVGSEELLKAIKIAAIDQRKTMRQIIIEALQEWLEKRGKTKSKSWQEMIEAVDEYRKTAGLSG
jgi:hypothetical protein